MLAPGTVLKLSKYEWTVVGPLTDSDPGGMGDVYLVTNREDVEGVAKLVDKNPAAERELLMAESVQAAGHHNVMSILDQGEHDDQPVLIMPRATTSLQGYLKLHPAPLSMDDLLPILTDVAEALADIHGEVVHRDLKPPNILLLNGSWCLADFGIARYADATTATQTHKRRFTKQYGAPEQWAMEHATAATDVYSFGVTAYLLAQGNLPFPGPTEADFRQQHLMEAPPPLTGGTRRLRDLITECLQKAPEARPTPAAIVERLKTIAEEPTVPGFSKLAALNTEHVQAQAEALREASIEQEAHARRDRLHRSAADLFAPIGNELMEAIRDNAPSVEFVTGPAAQGKLLLARFRGAELGLDAVQPSPPTSLPFTVISESVITLALPGSVHGWRGRSHSLWYCDAHEEGRFAWYELAFRELAMGGYQPPVEPYALSAKVALDVFSPGLVRSQLGWPVEEIDRSDPSVFLGRWLGWFADASAGTLSRPNPMPEKPTGNTWRPH